MPAVSIPFRLSSNPSSMLIHTRWWRYFDFISLIISDSREWSETLLNNLMPFIGWDQTAHTCRSRVDFFQWIKGEEDSRQFLIQLYGTEIVGVCGDYQRPRTEREKDCAFDSNKSINLVRAGKAHLYRRDEISHRCGLSQNGFCRESVLFFNWKFRWEKMSTAPSPEDNVDKFSRERHEIEIYDYARVGKYFPDSKNIVMKWKHRSMTGIEFIVVFAFICSLEFLMSFDILSQRMENVRCSRKKVFWGFKRAAIN